MSNKTQFKCSNKVFSKSGREVTCSAFVMEVSDGVFTEKLIKQSHIRLRCRKCSALYNVSIGNKGELEVFRIPERKKETANV